MAPLIKILTAFTISGIVSGAAAVTNPVTGLVMNLSSCVNDTATAINGIQVNGFNTTTQAITQQVPIVNGTASVYADTAISDMLNGLSQEITSIAGNITTAQPPYTNDTDWIAIAKAFNIFTNTFFDRYNAIDLAICKYEFTNKSQTFAVAVGPSPHEFESSLDNTQMAWQLLDGMFGLDPAFKNYFVNNSLPDLVTQWSGTANLFKTMGSGNQTLMLASCYTVAGLVCGNVEC